MVLGQSDVLRPKVVTPQSSKPKTYRDLYIASARYCPGLRWQDSVAHPTDSTSERHSSGGWLSCLTEHR